ncbi:hypothetical protein N9I58_02360 [Candidatus Thioglobus sp.]|nr:hypothetical protein [Candidatus Thioglobus sp.]
MSLINIVKLSFLKFISRNKVRPLPQLVTPKFLILMNQNIGDFIVCSPILREIKLALPVSETQVLVSEVNKDIALANPYIDKVHVYRNQWHKLLPILFHLKRMKFEFAIELEAKVVTKAILMLKVISPECVLAVSKTEGRYGMKPDSVLPYDYYTNKNLKHQRDTCLDILRLLNITCNNKSYDIFYTKQNKLNALSFLSSFEASKIIIGLNIEGSSEKNKILNEDVIKLILELYSMNNNIIVILLHKPKDRDRIISLIPDEASSFVFPSYPTKSVLDLAAIVDAVDLIISPDTSIVHMACALKKPLVAIYRDRVSNFDKWYPISDCNHIVFSKYKDSLKGIDISNIISKVLTLSLDIKHN